MYKRDKGGTKESHQYEAFYWLTIIYSTTYKSSFFSIFFSNWKKIFSQLERLFFITTSRRFHRLQHFLLQMLIQPQESGNEEEICMTHATGSPKQTPVHARAGTNQRLTPHLAIISITPLSIERLL